MAAEPDVSITERVHQLLEAMQLLPADHLVDAGFIDAELLVQAHDQFGITLCGPVQKDAQWQANQEEGFGLSDFHIDWDQRTATCPRGGHSGYTPEVTYTEEVVGSVSKTYLCPIPPTRKPLYMGILSF